MSIDVQDFQAHGTGRRFGDVLTDHRLPFQVVIDFFNQPGVGRRMRESEIHHDRAALAGVVKELEAVPELDALFQSHDAHTTQRTRQAVGVLVLMHLEAAGWAKTGRKASLGRRVRVAPGTRTPGAYYNRSGISRWFTQAERYVPRSTCADHALCAALRPGGAGGADDGAP